MSKDKTFMDSLYKENKESIYNYSQLLDNDLKAFCSRRVLFFGLIDKNFGLKYNFFGFRGHNYGL